MPLIYQDFGFTSYKSGGTLQVSGNVNVSSGLEVELRTTSGAFNAPGVWTVMTWTGTLTGTASNVTLINSTSLSCPSRPYLDGNSFKVALS